MADEDVWLVAPNGGHACPKHARKLISSQSKAKRYLDGWQDEENGDFDDEIGASDQDGGSGWDEAPETPSEKKRREELQKRKEKQERDERGRRERQGKGVATFSETQSAITRFEIYPFSAV